MLLKIYLGVTILTIIMTLLAGLRLYLNKNVMAELRNGNGKKSGDGKFITYLKFIVFIVLPLEQILFLFIMGFFFLADEESVINVIRKVNNK